MIKKTFKTILLALAGALVVTPMSESHATSPSGWKGIARVLQGYPVRPARITGELGAEWWYDWNVTAADLPNPNYVPMIWCSISLTDLDRLARTPPIHRTWLVFNEPDLAGQCNISASTAASRYKDYYNTIKNATRDSTGKTATVIVGGTAYLPNTTSGRNYWNSFLSGIGSTGIDGVHVHAYPHSGGCAVTSTTIPTAVNCLKSALQSTQSFFRNHSNSQVRRKPIWITETGILGNGSYDSRQMAREFTKPMLDWFKTARNGAYPDFRYIAWYGTNSNNCGSSCLFPDSNLIDAYGNATAVGEVWAEKQLLQQYWRHGVNSVYEGRKRWVPTDGTSFLWPCETCGWSAPEYGWAYPGTGPLLTLGGFVLANNLMETYWRGDSWVYPPVEARIRNIPMVSGRAQWNCASCNWSSPVGMAGLPGSGDIQAAADWVLSGRLHQVIWRNNYGYSRSLPIVNDVVQWSCSTCPWSSGYPLSELPGSGVMEAVDHYVLGGHTFYQVYWRGGARYSRSVPIVGGAPVYPCAQCGWTGQTIHNIPGSGSFLAQDSKLLVP